MRLDKIVLAVLAFSVFMVAGLYVMYGTASEQGIFNNYNVNSSNSSISKIYTNISETYELQKNIDDDLFDQKIESATSLENLLLGGYKALKQFKKYFSLIGDIVTEMAIYLGMSQFFVSFFVIAVWIVIIFSIIYLIFRFQGR